MNRPHVSDEPGNGTSSDDRLAVQAAVQLVDGRVRDFIAAMGAAGNPGARRHQLGGRTPRGWAFAFDPTTGGATHRVVIDTDGFICAPKKAPSTRAHRTSASSWLFDTTSPIEPMYRALAFTHELDKIQSASRVHT